jgi:hypothetical protein
MEYLPGGKRRVAPRAIANFFSKRLGVEALDDLTFAGLLGVTTTVGVNVVAFKGLGYGVNNTLAVTKQWYSNEESSTMMKDFYDAALETSLKYTLRPAGSALKTAGEVVGDAYAAGISAISTRGIISRLYNPEGKGAAAEAVREGIAAVDEVNTIVTEGAKESPSRFQAAVTRAQERVAARMVRLEKLREQENLENAGQALGVTFKTMAELKDFQSNLAKFAVEYPEGYKEVLEGKLPSFTTQSILQRQIQTGTGIGVLANVYTGAKDFIRGLGISMRIGSWVARGSSAVQSVTQSSSATVQQVPGGVCDIASAPKSSFMEEVQKACSTKNEDVIAMLPPPPIVESPSFLADVMGKSADVLGALDRNLPAIPAVAPIEVNTWRAINAVYGGFTVSNSISVASEILVGSEGARQVDTAVAALDREVAVDFQSQPQAQAQAEPQLAQT